MKITDVELIPVSTPLKKAFHMPGTEITAIHSIVLRVTTDTGHVGNGDCGDTSSWYRGEIPDSIQAMIQKHIAPRFLLGKNPLAIEKIVGEMDTFVRDNNQAKALVDFALHDLKGKVAGLPVYELLGGKTTEGSQQGWVAGAGSEEFLVQQAQAALKAGFSLIKIKSGGDEAQDVRNVKAVREAIGDDVRLVIDINGFWNYDQALHTIRKMDPYDLYCVEQPLPHWDIDGLARLRQRVHTPIFADESAQELHHLKEIIDRRAADGLFIKMQKAGGLVKAQRWLTMARLADLPVMSGCMIGSGLEASPSAHLMMSNQWASQFTHENLGPVTNNARYDTVNPPIEHDIAKNVPVFDQGKLYPNEGPGLGIELNEEFIERYQTPGKDIIVVE